MSCYYNTDKIAFNLIIMGFHDDITNLLSCFFLASSMSFSLACFFSHFLSFAFFSSYTVSAIQYKEKPNVFSICKAQA